MGVQAVKKSEVQNKVSRIHSVKSDKKEQRRSRTARLIILIVVLAVSTVLGWLHQFTPGLRIVGIDALCPFGGIESAYTLFASGLMIQRVAASSFIILIGILIVAVIFRRAFCGLICPLGALQELFAKLGQNILKRRLEVPTAIDKPARYLKYIILALTVALTYQMAELVIRPYDPWIAYHHIFGPELFTSFLIGFIVLILTLIGSLLYDRFFCKYACPMGAFLGLISRLSIYKIHRNESTCTSCSVCDKVCPVNIKVSELDVINSAECINCNECVNVCPVKDTLSVSSSRGNAISPTSVLTVVALVFVVIIAGTSATGLFKWQTKSLAEAAQEKGSFDAEAITGRMTIEEVSKASGVPTEAFKGKYGLSDEDVKQEIRAFESKGLDGMAARALVKEYLAEHPEAQGTNAVPAETDSMNNTGDGQVDIGVQPQNPEAQSPIASYDPNMQNTPSSSLSPDEIRGTMSLKEVAGMFGIPLETLREKFAINPNDVDKPLREIKGIYGFKEVYEIREFVGEYQSKK